MALSQSGIMAAWGPRCSGPYVRYKLYGGGVVVMKAAATEAIKAVNALLVKYNYKARPEQTGAFNCRLKVNGKGWSIHAYGAAFDINWLLNPYGGNRYHIPSALARDICAIRTNNGKQVWNWGGYWKGTKDWMHFDIVCRPQDLATGINWNTVRGQATKPTQSKIDWKALRRFVAASLLPRVSKLQALHTKVPPSASSQVKTLQEALNLIKDAKLQVNGKYDTATFMHVADWQNKLRALGLRVDDPVGYFGNYTKWWLVEALKKAQAGKG